MTIRRDASGARPDRDGAAGARPDRDGVTLAIDASSSLGTVAVLRGGVVVAEDAVPMRGEHEERLFPAIAAALAESRSPVREIARVVCGAGPGSFTSLRMAAAIAKGVAFGNAAVARETPLFPVSSLMLIVTAHASSHVPGRYLALLDAMRDERYAALVEVRADGRVVGLEPPNGGRIATHDTALWCDRLQARAIGPLEAIEAVPHARGVEQLLADIIARGAVAVDTWEPTYGRLAEAQVRWEAQHGRALVGDDG